MGREWTDEGRRRVEFCERYGLKLKVFGNMRRDVSVELMDQVTRCKSEEAKRLILGVSQKERAA